MMTTVLIILIVSSLFNIVADIMLLWGIKHTKWEPNLESILKTPTKLLLIGSLSGLIILPFWFIPIRYLAKIPGIVGQIALYSYLLYITVLIFFHVAYAFVGIGAKESATLYKKYETIITAIAGYSFLLSIIFTGAMIYLGVTNILDMSWCHYITLPTFAIMIFRIISTVFKKVPYLVAISGTLAMLTFFIGFIHMVSNNVIIFM